MSGSSRSATQRIDIPRFPFNSSRKHRGSQVPFLSFGGDATRAESNEPNPNRAESEESNSTEQRSRVLTIDSTRRLGETNPPLLVISICFTFDLSALDSAADRSRAAPRDSSVIENAKLASVDAKGGELLLENYSETRLAASRPLKSVDSVAE